MQLKIEVQERPKVPPFLKYMRAEKCFFRFVISSGHTRAQLEGLVAVVLENARADHIRRTR